MDPDLFQHIAVGREILANPRSLGVSNFIEAYPDYPYVEDKWLACVVVALVERLGGIDGVMLYQIALCVAVAAAWYDMQRAWGASRAVGVFGVVVALLVCAFRLEPRPDTVSHALLALTIAMVARPVPFRRLLALTAALFVVWINVHGYFVNGILVLVAAAVATALGDRKLRAPGMPTAGERTLVVAAALAACLVHPQGWWALAGPVLQLTLMRSATYHGGIQELEPIGRLFTGASTLQWVVFAVPYAIALALAVRHAAGGRGSSATPRQAAAALAALPWLAWPPTGMADALPYRATMALWVMASVEVLPALAERRLFAPLVFAGFTVLAAPAVRNLPLVAPAGLLMVAPAWTAIEEALSERARGRALTRAALVATAALVVWLRVSDRLNGFVRAPTRTGWGVDADRFPVGAADFLLRNDLPGPLLNGFDVGGYLLYRVHPARRVFIAGNTSMYPLEFFETYMQQVGGASPSLDAIAARWPFETVVWDLASPSAQSLLPVLAADPRWKLVYLDHGGVAFTAAPAAAPLDLPARVAELATRAVEQPALPTWLGGKTFGYPVMNLPAFLFNTGHPNLALALAEPLWTDAPSEALAVLIGAAATQTNAVGPRLPMLEAALARWPTSRDLFTLVFVGNGHEANRLLARGAAAQARPHLERMRALQPQACGPYTGLARAAILSGDRAEAAAMARAALARDGDGACRGFIASDPSLAALLR